MTWIDEWQAARMRLLGEAGRAEMRAMLARLRDLYNTYNRRDDAPVEVQVEAAVQDMRVDGRSHHRDPIFAAAFIMLDTERDGVGVEVVAAYYGEDDPRNTVVPDEPEDTESKRVIRGPWADRSSPVPMAARDTPGPVLP